MGAALRGGVTGWTGNKQAGPAGSSRLKRGQGWNGSGWDLGKFTRRSTIGGLSLRAATCLYKLFSQKRNYFSTFIAAVEWLWWLVYEGLRSTRLDIMIICVIIILRLWMTCK